MRSPRLGGEPVVVEAGAAGFQEAAVPPRPRLYAWGARALYVGPALGLTPHRNAVAVLAMGLERPFGVANDPERPQAGYRSCRSSLILPDTLHHLDCGPGEMAFLYLDARSSDLQALLARAGSRADRAAFDVAGEGELIESLRALASGARDWRSVRKSLDQALAGDPVGVDPRIAAALSALHADPGERLSLAALARRAGLSQSRFRRLFRRATGVTVRRYRIWLGMAAAAREFASGSTLTQAAMAGGFASSAHFSSAFRSMFGLEPSRVAGRGAIAPSASPTASAAPRR